MTLWRARLQKVIAQHEIATFFKIFYVQKSYIYNGPGRAEDSRGNYRISPNLNYFCNLRIWVTGIIPKWIISVKFQITEYHSSYHSAFVQFFVDLFWFAVYASPDGRVWSPYHRKGAGAYPSLLTDTLAPYHGGGVSPYDVITRLRAILPTHPSNNQTQISRRSM